MEFNNRNIFIYLLVGFLILLLLINMFSNSYHSNYYGSMRRSGVCPYALSHELDIEKFEPSGDLSYNNFYKQLKRHIFENIEKNNKENEIFKVRAQMVYSFFSDDKSQAPQKENVLKDISFDENNNVIIKDDKLQKLINIVNPRTELYNSKLKDLYNKYKKNDEDIKIMKATEFYIVKRIIELLNFKKDIIESFISKEKIDCNMPTPRY